MRERGVTMADVRNVLSGRGPAHPSARKRVQAGRGVGGARLEVVYTEATTGEFRVVSVRTPDR
jgi:uncharacterized DUF497 family protein